MKIPFFCLFLLVATLPGVETITQAMGSGDVVALRSYLDQTVEIALLDRENSYSRARAAEVLQGFFRQNPPKAFTNVRQGTSRSSDSQYCIGDLVTANGTFRVNIYMRSDGSRVIIQEMRFDRV